MSAQWVTTINQWADYWAAGFWRACWQGGVVILLVWGLCRVLPQMSPRVRCWLWRLAYFKLLMALFWTSPIEIPLLRSARMPEPIAASIQKPAIYPTSHLPRLRRNRIGGTAYSVVTKTLLTPLSALMILWLLGGMAVGMQIVWEWRSVRLRRSTAPLDVVRYATLAEDFERLCQRSGIGRPISLLVTNASDRPHVSGVIHPAIVLPAESERIGLLAVVAHEIAHIQRKDLLWNWLPAITHTLFFFCPFVWLANREWQLAQEIACDEMAVLNTRTGVAEYGEMLVRMVISHQYASRSGIATLGIIETPQTLKRRLIAMRFIHPISRRKLALVGGTCIALGIVGIVPWQVTAQEAKTNRILFVANRLDAHRFPILAMNSDGSHITRLTHGLTHLATVAQTSHPRSHVTRLIHGPLRESNVVATPSSKFILRPAVLHHNANSQVPIGGAEGPVGGGEGPISSVLGATNMGPTATLSSSGLSSVSGSAGVANGAGTSGTNGPGTGTSGIGIGTPTGTGTSRTGSTGIGTSDGPVGAGDGPVGAGGAGGASDGPGSGDGPEGVGDHEGADGANGGGDH